MSSSSSESSSIASEISSAPSSPISSTSYYLVIGTPSLLKPLSLRLKGEDRLFFISGTGKADDVLDVLAQAEKAVGVCDPKWACDKRTFLFTLARYTTLLIYEQSTEWRSTRRALSQTRAM